MLGKFPLDFQLANFCDKHSNKILDINIGCSTSSRLGNVVEIGDLSDTEAMEFLSSCNKRGMSKSISQDIYGLVGGRVGLLVTTINKLNSGQDLAGISPTYLVSDTKQEISD